MQPTDLPDLGTRQNYFKIILDKTFLLRERCKTSNLVTITDLEEAAPELPVF